MNSFTFMVLCFLGLWLLPPVEVNAAPPPPLPDFKRLPDYRRTDRCLPFSEQCLAALHARGIPATQVYYLWNAPSGVGAHAAVIFQHEGAFWFMDNTRLAPRRVTAKTDHGCIVQVSPKNAFIHLVDRLGRSVKPQDMAKRFERAGI